MKFKRMQNLIISLFIVFIYGCATTGTTDQKGSDLNLASTKKTDPYENFNRKMFHFNDKVDNYVAEPISNAYKFITPQFVQTVVFNFFNNLKNINIVINDLLQAKFSQSMQDTGRFAMNSVLGLGGLFDVAKNVGLEQNDEDFEQTLAVWGVPQGSYLVLPFLGPSTTRGIPGSIFDTAANPTTYVGLPVQLLSMLNSRANAEGSLKFIDEAALDPYVFTRESFLQWRNNLATDGKAAISSDFDDELLDSTDDTTTSGLDNPPGTSVSTKMDGSKPAIDARKLGYSLQLNSPTSQSNAASASTTQPLNDGIQAQKQPAKVRTE